MKRIDTPEYRESYQKGWTYSKRDTATIEHLDRLDAPDATYDGYLDYAAGRDKWHLLHCDNHEECGQ